MTTLHVHDLLTTLKSNGEKSQTQKTNIEDKAKKVEMKPTFLDSHKAKKVDQCQTKSCQPTIEERYQAQSQYCQAQSANKVIIQSERIYNILPL